MAAAYRVTSETNKWFFYNKTMRMLQEKSQDNSMQSGNDHFMAKSICESQHKIFKSLILMYSLGSISRCLSWDWLDSIWIDSVPIWKRSLDVPLLH